MKNILSFLKPVIYSYTVQYLFIIIGILLCFLLFKIDIRDMSNIYRYAIIGIVITSIPISCYLYKKYYVKEDKINIKRIVIMMFLGLSISLFYNMVTYGFHGDTNIEINKILLFLYIGIGGPIFEEFVFRYVSLKLALKNFSVVKSIIYISIVFALLHSGLIGMLYAFLISMVLSYIYIKYNNIIYPIIIHISANIMSLCITSFNMFYLFISFLVLIIILIYIRDDHI